MLIDSHAHLDMSQFDRDRDEVIGKAIRAGVEEILNVSYDSASIDGAAGLAERYGRVYASAGVHPHEAEDWSDEIEERIKTLLLRRKVLAVGEIGLDYYRDLSPRPVQREVFKKQIGIALYFGKPIVVHCREAMEDVLDIMKREGAREVGGIFHAFPGGLREAEEIMKLGFVLGIGGPVTYKNSRLPETVKRLPSSGFVLETDSPYLPPQPYRGKRNEPAHVAIVARKVAEIKNVTVADIERATEANYRRVIRREERPPANVTYSIKDNLYVNVTNFCTNDCVFCARRKNNNTLYGYNLDLDVEPGLKEIVSEIGDEASGGGIKEIVFCGYGEPTARLEVVLNAAREAKRHGIAVRLNTNGQGNMINQRNIVPDLEGVFDRISISLNAPDRSGYLDICRPDSGREAFDSVIDFIKAAALSRMDCVVTAVDYPGVDVEKCAGIVDAIEGAEFRVRTYHLDPPA